MKVDFGVHVKGRVLDSAFTLAFDHKYDKLLEAVRAATDTGVRVRMLTCSFSRRRLVTELTRVCRKRVSMHALERSRAQSRRQWSRTRWRWTGRCFQVRHRSLQSSLSRARQYVVGNSRSLGSWAHTSGSKTHREPERTLYRPVSNTRGKVSMFSEEPRSDQDGGRRVFCNRDVWVDGAWQGRGECAYRVSLNH